MVAFFVVFIVLTIISFAISLFGFMGENIISDDTYLKLVIESAYLKASAEERKTMNKRAYRVRGASCFLFIGIANLCILLQPVLHCMWPFYLGAIIYIFTIVFGVVTDFTIKKK